MLGRPHRGGGRIQKSYTRSRPEKASWVRNGLAELVQQFEVNMNVPPAQVAEYRAVASYSWIEIDGVPTIMVPGCPPVWTEPGRVKIPQDSGLVYIDRNASNMGAGRSPLLPLFVASEAMGDAFDIDLTGVHIVTDRNNIKKLLKWATSDVEKDFMIDVDLAGETCLFTRHEERDSEVIRDFQGYGHGYELAATRPALGSENAVSHHRIQFMNLSGMKILLRFEVDACIEPQPIQPPRAPDPPEDYLRPEQNPVRWSKTLFGIVVHADTTLGLVAQSDLVELKTRPIMKDINWSNASLQIYISQTPHLYVGRHDWGDFRRVDKIQLTDPLMLPHITNVEEGLGRVKEVLERVSELAQQIGQGAELSLICENGTLALYRRNAGSGKRLPDEVLDKFKPK